MLNIRKRAGVLANIRKIEFRGEGTPYMYQNF